MIDLSPCPVQEGDFLFLSSGVLHRYSGRKDQISGDGQHCVPSGNSGKPEGYLSGQVRVSGRRGGGALSAVIRGKAAEKLNRVFQKLKKSYLEKEEGYEIEVKALLLHITYLLFREVPYEKNSREKGQVVEKLKLVLQYIKEHYQHPITVRELADACHFSEYYFMRFFKQYMNMTCVEYLNQYRMEIAAGKLPEAGKASQRLPWTPALTISHTSTGFLRKASA